MSQALDERRPPEGTAATPEHADDEGVRSELQHISNDLHSKLSYFLQMALKELWHFQETGYLDDHFTRILAFQIKSTDAVMAVHKDAQQSRPAGSSPLYSDVMPASSHMEGFLGRDTDSPANKQETGVEASEVGNSYDLNSDAEQSRKELLERLRCVGAQISLLSRLSHQGVSSTSLGSGSSNLSTSGTLNDTLTALRNKFNRLSIGSLNELSLSSDWRGNLQRGIRKMTNKPWFESMFAGIIFLNAICMIVEFQLDGIQLSRRLGLRGATQGPNESNEKILIFEVLEWLFGIVFALELLLNILVKGRRLFNDAFALVDIFAVVFFLIERAVGAFPVGSAWIRTLRLARIGRLLRLVRKIEQFDNLYLMTTAIRGSISILSWALVLFIVIQMTVALVVGQVLQAAYFDRVVERPDADSEAVHKMFMYFGTWTRAMLSVFEMTFANWAPICRMLTEEVSEWFILVCLLHKLTIGFAVIGVVNGVFMQETFKVASTDDVIMIRQKTQATNKFRENMWRLFQALDTNSDGHVTRRDFRSLGKCPEIRTWLSSMEIQVDDFGSAFSFLDQSSRGSITFEEFAGGFSRLKGFARSADLLREMKKQDGRLKFIRTATSLVTSTLSEQASVEPVSKHSAKKIPLSPISIEPAAKHSSRKFPLSPSSTEPAAKHSSRNFTFSPNEMAI